MKPYYADDLVTLYHGDCREVAPTLSADVVITDPPYGLGERWQGGTWGANPMYADARKWDAVAFPLPDLLALIGDRPAVVWGGNYYALPPSRCWLAWEKASQMPTMADFELAWTNLDRPAKRWREARNPDGARQHPTQKPLSLMEWCLGFMPVGTVFDPFAGSGTTLRAAKNLNRRSVGIEINEAYAEIAAERCRQEVLDLGAV